MARCTRCGEGGIHDVDNHVCRPDRAQAVPRSFASSYCDKTADDMDGEMRYRVGHTHRCTGEHGELLGVVTHSCKCGAVFYFLEDMLDLVVGKLLERESVEITPLGAHEREYITGGAVPPPIDHPI